MGLRESTLHGHVSMMNFTAVINLLAYIPTAAPVYIILVGINPGEGAVIAKGRLEPDDKWMLDPGNDRRETLG